MAGLNDGCAGLVSEDSSSMYAMNDVKNQIRLHIQKDEYDVCDFYHKTGFCQWLARHPRFEHVTLLVIGLNAAWIWIDTDLNPGAMLILAPPIFQVVEHFFCAYFAYEWTIRYGAFKKKRNCLRDFWFVFDSLLVGTMVFETWIMSAVMLAAVGSVNGMGNTGFLRIARLLRLTRMARMARLLRALPELLILIKGMVAALRSVCFALGLLGMILYVFGIAFTQLCEGTSLEPSFETVMRSMHTLLVYGALMDEVSGLVIEIEEESILLLVIFYIFILLAALTVMNMLIGVICEMVLKVGAAERQEATKGFVTEKLMELIETGTDENNDNLISKEEFIEMLRNKRATGILHEVGVDVVGLVDFADTIFEQTPGAEHLGEKQLTLGEFMKVVLDLRGDQSAKVRDVMGLRKYMAACFVQLEQKLIHDVQVVGRSSSLPSQAEKPVPSSVPVTQSRNPVWAKATEACNAVSAWGSVAAKGSKELEPMSLDSLQEQITTSLQKIRSTHERELASLHAENLKLLDKLKDLGIAAGKSLGAVLQVANSVPQSPNASSPQPSVVEQPRVQVGDSGMDGLPVAFREGKHSMPKQDPAYAAVDACSGRREPAKQGTGNHRLSMDLLMEEARRSLAKHS